MDSSNVYHNGLVTQAATGVPNYSGNGGNGPTQSSLYSYDEPTYVGSGVQLGLLTTVKAVGNPNYPTITSHWSYTTDNVYAPNGSPGSYSTTASIGEPLVFTNNDSKQTHYRYDHRGNCIMVIDALGNETDYTYNLADQMLTMAQYSPYGGSNPHAFLSGTSVTYLYTGGPASKEQIYSSANASTPLREIDFTYGHEGELLKESAYDYVSSNASYTIASYTYDGLYHVLSYADGYGNTTHYSYYVANGRLASMQYPEKPQNTSLVALGSVPANNPNNDVADAPCQDTLQFTSYDADGNLLGFYDGNGAGSVYSYDDPASMLKKISYYYPAGYAGTELTQSPTFTYDSYSRLASLTDNVFVAGSGTPGESFSYDDLDNLMSKKFNYASAGALAGLGVAYSYNADGTRAAMNVPLPGFANNLGSFFYGYDDLGRMTTMYNPFNDETEWAYNADDWLLSQAAYGNGATLVATNACSYDPRGLVTQLLETGTGGALISEYGNLSAGTPMTYDAAGNRLTMSVAYTSPHVLIRDSLTAVAPGCSRCFPPARIDRQVLL